MSSKMKQWVALTAVGCLAVLAAGWFLLVSPKRSEASQVRAQVTSQQSQNSQLQTQLAMLKQEAKTFPQQQAKLAAVAAKIPDNPALPALIRALSSAADETNVELVSLSPGQPAAVAAVAAPAGSRTLGAAPSTGPAATLGSTTPAAGAGAVPGAAATSTGVLNSISVNLNVVGGYFQLEQFFDKVENLTRAMKVSGFTLAPGANPLKPSTAATGVQAASSTLSATVSANVYMAAGRTAVPAVAVPTN